MKAMKGLGMNKMLGTIKRRATSGLGASTSTDNIPDPQGDGPEAVAATSVKQFCSSGGPNSQGDEVLYLPPIVEAAESSPAAAAVCAQLIRRFLSKDYHSKPSHQYNAIMLIRILADNPGPTFTRNLDKKFVDTCKDLLRAGKDPNVRTLLMETLDTFEYTKVEDEGLYLMIEMWKKEKEKAYKSYGHRMPPQHPGPRTLNAPPFDPNASDNQNYFSRNHHSKKLPDPVQLAARLEEARTSAKLLSQVVGHTPPHELLNNDLVKEFADRCQSASRSIQGYMVADNPAPDNDTMESLIDTNEQLQSALNTHQRAVLSARKQLGINARSNETPSPVSPTEANGKRPAAVQQSSSGSNPPPLPARDSGKGKSTEAFRPPPGPPPGNNKGLGGDDHGDDPFKDPEPSVSKAGPSSSSTGAGEARLAYEPFHPGFQGTQSYMGRQESALGKLHMHGAGASSSSSSSTPAPPSEAGGSSSKQTTGRRAEEEDDLYGSTPRSKEPPMYRY